MRLSEAILLGSYLCKAKSGGADYGGAPSFQGGCALEMANLAMGVDKNWLYSEEIWTWLKGPAPFGTVVPHCDNPRWSRYIAQRFDNEVMNYKTSTLEQLVDWVRSVEPSEESEVPSEQHVASAVRVAE